jgi:4-hydroxybenzoate polyprenyltransferase
MAVPSIMAWLRLIRVQTLAITALVPVIGALVFLGESPSGVGGWDQMQDLVLLFSVGGFLHVFGFVLNEWADVEVDRASTDLKGKPLVSGQIGRGGALKLAIGSAALCFIPLAFVTTDVLVLGVMASSIAMAAVYDLFGKRMPLDTVLAGSLTLLLLTGAMAIGEFDTGSVRHWTIFGCIGGYQFLMNLFENAIEGGIKDIDHDANAGARTFAVITKVRIEDDEIVPSRVFIVSGWVMKAMQLIILAYVLLFVVDMKEGLETVMVAGLAISFVILMMITLLKFMGRRAFDRPTLKRTFSFHEIATFGAIMTVFVPLIGGYAFIAVLVMPVLWFMVFNRALYQGFLEPGV